MGKLIFLTGMILLAALGSRAQEVPSAEVSASYSFLRFGVSHGVNQHGGSASLAGNFNRWLGLAADFGGYRTSQLGIGWNTYTYLGGPRLSYRKFRNVTAFAQVLLGGGHSSVNSSGLSASVNGFAYSAGGGLDLGITEQLAFRPQLDYIGLSLAGSTVNTVRGSFGIVFRFGKR